MKNLRLIDPLDNTPFTGLAVTFVHTGFNLTLWCSSDGFTAGVQKHAGALVKYETRRTASEAIEAALGALRLTAPPY